MESHHYHLLLLNCTNDRTFWAGSGEQWKHDK
jgi:hypothetical protein